MLFRDVSNLVRIIFVTKTGAVKVCLSQLILKIVYELWDVSMSLYSITSYSRHHLQIADVMKCFALKITTNTIFNLQTNYDRLGTNGNHY